MIIEFVGFQLNCLMLYLFKKGESEIIEWGQEFNVIQFQSYIVVIGQLKGFQFFLQLDFSYVVCGDGGWYMCLYGGFDKQGKFRKFFMFGDFIV